MGKTFFSRIPDFIKEAYQGFTSVKFITISSILYINLSFTNTLAGPFHGRSARVVSRGVSRGSARHIFTRRPGIITGYFVNRKISDPVTL